MAAAAVRANVRIVAGDTKVVEHGKADGMYICTTGSGRGGMIGPTLVWVACMPGDHRARFPAQTTPHGMTIMMARARN